jgi:hypothetical protein
VKTLTVDDYKRVRLPDAAPRSKFAYETDGNGRVTLTPLAPVEPPPAKVRLEKRGGFTVLVSDRPVSESAIKEALADFP